MDVENKRHIGISEGLKHLLVISQRKSENTIVPETLAVGISRLEAPDMKVKAGTISELTQTDFGKPPYALISPARLHFAEAEALELFCGARKELVGEKHD